MKSMDARICSLETEFALVSNVLSDDRTQRDKLADLIESVICQNFQWVRCNSFGRNLRDVRGSNLVQIREGQFIENGSRVYYDAGHFEWANPETIDPYKAVLYDKAAEKILNQAVGQASEYLKGEYPANWIMLVKNNIDYSNDTSYGCHENYSLLRKDQWGRDVFSRLEQDLTPFLVTRQIYCGAGRVGARHVTADNPCVFQISQRADFIEQTSSKQTREQRSILNERDEALADKDIWRRLHLILGDSNMSEIAAYLKLGTTALVLSAVEANNIQGRWALKDPVDAMHRVSRDWKNSVLTLRRGENATAFQIQRQYCNLVKKMVQILPPDHFAHAVVRLWTETLDDLEKGGALSSCRLDWAIKQQFLFGPLLKAQQTDWLELGYWLYVFQETEHLTLPANNYFSLDWLKKHLQPNNFRKLEHYAQTHHLDWRLYPSRRSLFGELRERDFRYHDIGDRGLYSLLRQFPDTIQGILNDKQQLQSALQSPPKDTRAWQRGQIIASSHKSGVQIEMDWDKVLLVGQQKIIPMPNPFNPEQFSLDEIRENNLKNSDFSETSRKPEIKIISKETVKKG